MEKDQYDENVNLQDLCIVHQRSYKLFCMDCINGFCGACMDIGDHDLHQISSLAVVYGEKLSFVKDKLTKVQKYYDELRSGSSATYERNLQVLEKEETSLRDEIEEIHTDAEQELSSRMNERKRVLFERLDLATKNNKVLTDLKSKVEKLSANEFMQQFSNIVQKCDALFDDLKAVTLQSVDDFQCRLIPPFHFQQVLYPGFLRAEHNDEHDFKLNSAHDVEWRLTVYKSDILRIRLCALDAQVATLRHVLKVVIPHPDYTKEIRQTFEINEQDKTVSMVSTTQISEEQFCNPDGDLVMKIGIRPLNTLIEKELVDYQYVQLKETNEQLIKRLQSFTNEYDYKHLIMYFNIRLAQFRKDEYLKSYRIRDDDNREWCMNLKLNKNDMVAAYIELAKGSGTKCRFFIELEHTNPQKSIHKYSISKRFDFGAGNQPTWGFDLMTWNELISDTGFQRNGYLHFRFGVRPLLPTTDSGSGRTPVRKTSTMTPAEPNEGTSMPAQKKHVSFAE